MKDASHHLKKLNREVVRHPSVIKDGDLPLVKIEESKEEHRKKQKIEMRKERDAHIPTHKTPEERNQEQKRNEPIREGNHKVH